MKGVRDGLGAKAGMIIADKSYEVSDPTIDSQIVALKDSGADIFMTWAAPKGAAQAIRKVGELGWKPAETFETGIRKTIAWYLANPEWVAHVQSGAYRQWVDKQYAGTA